MMRRHEDIFMWNTIKDVTRCSNDIREVIYDQLYGKTWSINRIEQLEQELQKGEK